MQCRPSTGLAPRRTFQLPEVHTANLQLARRWRVNCRTLTLFSLRNVSGLLLLSIRILAIALKTAGSWLPDWTRVSSQGRMSFSLFLCSTSWTSSSIGKFPVTEASSPLMVVSSQSTSRRPPTTCGVRTELTRWTYTSMNLVRPF